ncbi:hypothetical protein OBRU01_02564 [Operophtera brumata]|uniref:Uncharacterized protein n=1 Tax=Operophtera brumata TaxID=104452 RepID=A0A0L7LS70_OPEBR|nr:hypothetical protein OBRU01_02564 [Operophtera brumata]
MNQSKNEISKNYPKLVTGLGDKVTNLEVRISEQSAIISAQTKVISQLKSAMEVTQQQPTAPSAQPPAALTALQRPPVRQARLKAAAAAAAAKTGSSETTKSASSAEKPRGFVPSGLSTTPEVGRSGAKTNAKLLSMPDACIIGIKSVSDTQNEWKRVSHKRPLKRRTIITGMGKDYDELQTVEKPKYIQAWALRPETTAQNVLTFVNKIKSSSEYVVEKRQIKTDRFSSFVIGIPESLYDHLSEPT